MTTTSAPTTSTPTTPTRQARGIALAEQGAVSASLDPNTWYILGSPVDSKPDAPRRIHEIQRRGRGFHCHFHCSCRDFELHGRLTPCKHIHAVQEHLRRAEAAATPDPELDPELETAPAAAWRVVVIHEKLRTWAHCRAYAPGVAATKKAALVRHHRTGNITLDLPWAIHYVTYLSTFTTRKGNKIAVLRAEIGLRWYVPLEAWEAIQPRPVCPVLVDLSPDGLRMIV